MGVDQKALAEIQPLGGTAIKPEGWDRTGLEAFKYFLYNPKTGEIMTRTPKSWALIFIFYVIYYSCLAAFWIACLQIFFLTLPDTEPRWTLKASIIGTNPGVGLRPKNSDKMIDSSMFALDLEDVEVAPSNDEGEGERNSDWAKRMELFLETYKNTTGLKDCPDNAGANAGKCIFDVSNLQACGNKPYGYLPVGGQIQPCMLLKLNKIWDWSPKGILKADLDNKAYESMTPTLKKMLKESAHEFDDEGRAKNVYIDCFGRYGADKEGMELTYFPANQGLPLKYFPFKGGNYHSPLVAIKVTPKTDGQLLHVECRAWFDGVEHVTKDKMGLVQFEVHVHKKGVK